jgi:hypothetical protein
LPLRLAVIAYEDAVFLSALVADELVFKAVAGDKIISA